MIMWNPWEKFQNLAFTFYTEKFIINAMFIEPVIDNETPEVGIV